jgi:hypothetical protein
MKRSIPFLLLAAQVFGHHSVSAEFDMNRTVTVEGRVDKVQWTNPHALVWVKLANSTTLQFELPPPHTLKRQGITQDFVKEGDPITVTFWPAKDSASNVAHALTFLVADGRKIEFPRGLGWSAVLKDSK